MTIYKDPTGALMDQGQQYTAPDGTTHPAGNDLSGLGYPVVTETPRPTDPNIVVLGWHEENLAQVWDTRLKTADETKAETNNPILRQIAALDASSTRPLRAVLAAQAVGTDPDPADVERLVDLNAQAADLRSRLVP